MAEMIVARVTLKIALNLFAPQLAAKLGEGDVGEENMRQALLSEFKKINEHLHALRRKELVSALNLLETGFELLYKDPKTSKEEFHKARENAQMAFGVVKDIEDKVLATKVLVTSTVHEFSDNTETAKSLCLKYLERLNTLPEVMRSCELKFSPDSKLSNRLLAFSGKAKRDDLLQGVAEVNRTVCSQFLTLSTVPAIRFERYHINPVTELVLYRAPKIICELTLDLTKFVSVCCNSNFMFAALGRKHELKNDIIALNFKTKSITHLLAHENIVLSVCANDTHLFSSSYDQKIIVWDLKTLSPLKTITEHTGSVPSICLSDSFLFTGSTDSTIKLFDHCDDFKLVDTFDVESPVIKITCSKLKYLFCLLRGNEIQIWDVTKHVKRHSFKTNYDRPNDLFASTSNLIISSYFNNELSVETWNLGSLTLSQNYKVPNAENLKKLPNMPYAFCLAGNKIQMISTVEGKFVMEVNVEVGGKVATRVKCITLHLHDLYALCQVNNNFYLIKY